MWSIIYNLKKSEIEHKVRRNNVSAIHCATTIALYRFGVSPYLTLFNSMSYFIWDSMYSVRNLEWTMVVHHVLALVLCMARCEVKSKIETLALMETSNIFNYIVYDLIKSKKDSVAMRLVQAFWFGYYRLVKIPMFFSQNSHTCDLRLHEEYITYLLNLMGYVWTFMMFVSLNAKAKSLRIT